MRYSQEFKDNVVARLLSKELSISEAVEQYSIGKSTISYWLKIAREQAVCGTLPNKGNLKPMTSLKLPKGCLLYTSGSRMRDPLSFPDGSSGLPS